MPMADLTAERPPLAPELWNFAVVLVICAILAWMLRLLRLLLVLVDMRYALYAQAVRLLRALAGVLDIESPPSPLPCRRCICMVLAPGPSVRPLDWLIGSVATHF